MKISDALRQYELARAKKRKHHPCPAHGKVRTVCAHCLKVYCPKCKNHPCALSKETTKKPRRVTVNYVPPPAMRDVWTLVSEMGAISIEPQPDSGAWMFIFPPNALGTQSASDLSDRLWSRTELKALAEPTAWTAGRGNNPPHWWVGFDLK
jgi:hypothetical protein